MASPIISDHHKIEYGIVGYLTPKEREKKRKEEKYKKKGI
jgi:hypothetical protein